MKRCILGNQRCCCRLSSDPCRRPPAESKKKCKKNEKNLMQNALPVRMMAAVRKQLRSAPLCTCGYTAAQRSAQLPVTTSRLTQVSWTEAAAGLKHTTPPSVPSSPPGNKSPTLPAASSCVDAAGGANRGSLFDWLTSAGVIKFIRHHWGGEKSLKA